MSKNARFLTDEQAHERLMAGIKRAQGRLRAQRLAQEAKSGKSQSLVHGIRRF